MVTLDKSFKSFADDFDIPEANRPALLNSYKAEYNRAMGITNGQEIRREARQIPRQGPGQTQGRKTKARQESEPAETPVQAESNS